jgi:folate-binding protein YgfZ
MAPTLQPAAVPTSNPDSDSASDSAAQLSALLTAVAIAPLTDRAFLRITGPDAQRWLNGMVTNNIQSLQPGQGNYNFLLNAQGRIVGDCTIYREPAPEPPAFLLETDASQIEAIRAHLDRFIIMDDVELQPAPSNLSCLLVLGPHAPSILRDRYRSLCGGDRNPLQPLRLAFDSDVAEQITTPSAGLVPQFQIWTSAASIGSLTQYALAAGATPVSPSALEHLRILSGTPRYGVDIRNTDTAHDLPQETAQTRALHFSKGCYLGQEIVERIHSRGNVHRTFAGFQLTGPLPAPGAALTGKSFDRPVGELTSVAAIPLPAGPIQLALGYIRREALDRNLPLEYPGGTATPIALPYAIP